MAVLTPFFDVVAGVAILAGRSSLLDKGVFKTANTNFTVRHLLALGFIGYGGWNLWKIERAQDKLKKTLDAESFSADWQTNDKFWNMLYEEHEYLFDEDGMVDYPTEQLAAIAKDMGFDAESFSAESQKLGIIYRIDRDDKTADILGVLSSYAEGKKAMTYMFKSALEEYSEDSGEDLMSFSDGKKEFGWYESRSKKKKHLDFFHPTGYEDVIIVLQEFRIETLMDFYDMINEDKFSAETFNAESFGAEEDVGVGSEKWRKEPKAWKMMWGWWIDNIFGEQHETAQEAVALYDDEIAQGGLDGLEVPTTPYQRMLDAGLKPQSGTEVYDAESFEAPKKRILRGKRPSPSTSATSVNIGTQMRGGNNKMWVCKSYPRGKTRVKRWVLAAEEFGAEDEGCFTCGRVDKNPDYDLMICDFCKCVKCHERERSGPSYSYCEMCYEEENPEDEGWDTSDYGWSDYEHNAEEFGAESFEAPSCNCERFNKSAWDSNRCATCGEMRKGHYGAESFEAPGEMEEEDFIPMDITQCHVCARPYEYSRIARALVQHYLKESDDGTKGWKNKSTPDGTRRTARNIAGYQLYWYGLGALENYLEEGKISKMTPMVIDLLRTAIVPNIIAGDVVQFIESMEIDDIEDTDPTFFTDFSDTWEAPDDRLRPERPSDDTGDRSKYRKKPRKPWRAENQPSE